MDKLTAEVFADYCEPQELCLSLDGFYVTYVLYNSHSRAKEHRVSSIWLADCRRERSARQMTSYDHLHGAPKFNPRATHISFLTDRKCLGQTSSIYLLPVDGGEAYPVITAESDKGITSYAWNSKGDSIAYACSSPDGQDKKKAKESKKDQKVHDEDYSWGRLWLAVGKDQWATAIESKDIIRAPTGDNHVCQFAWKPDGTEIVLATSLTPSFEDSVFYGGNIKIWNLESNVVRDITTIPGDINELCWTPGIGVNFRAAYNLDKSLIGAKAVWCIYDKDLVKSNPQPTLVAFGEHDCAGEIKLCSDVLLAKVYAGNNERLQLVVPQRDGQTSTSFTATFIHDQPYRIHDWDVTLFSKSDHQSSYVIAKSSPNEPCQVYAGTIYSSNGDVEQLIQLSNHNPHLQNLDFAESHLIDTTHPDGTPITGYYLVPTKLKNAFKKKKPLPCIVTNHGGPYGRSAVSFYDPMPAPLLLAKQKYILLQPNYRGGAGHGDAYAQTVRGSPDASYLDVIALVEEGIKNGIIDKDKIVINGWSQGGYLAYMAVADPPEAFRWAGAIAGAGVSDWSAMCLTSDIPSYEGLLGNSFAWESTDTSVEAMRKGSPLYLLGSNRAVWGADGDRSRRTPVLMLHGQEDERVPVEQAVGFWRAMKAKRWTGKDEKGSLKRAELVTYPREGHGGGDKPWEKEHYIDMLKRIERFVEQSFR